MPSVMYVYAIVLACVLYGTVQGQNDCGVDNCMVCDAGENSTTCMTCDSRFYEDMAGECQGCTTENCATCPDDVCSECDTDFTINNNGTCEESSGGEGEGGASSLWSPSFGTFSLTAVLTVVLAYQENILR